MKYSYVALVAFSGLAAAQSTLPTCAQPCVADAVAASTDCAADDIACQCIPANKAAIQGAATSCVLEACGIEQAPAVIAAANAACEGAGEASETPSATPTPTPSATPSPSAPAETTASAEPSTTAPTSTPTPKPSSNVTTTAPPPEFTGAAAQFAASIGSVFAIGMAVLAAF